MALPTIRPGRPDEYDEIARIWMESWTSTGLTPRSDGLLNDLRARLPREIAGGWSLFVADDRGTIAAMLALHLPTSLLDQFARPPDAQTQASIGPNGTITKVLARHVTERLRTEMGSDWLLTCGELSEEQGN